MNRVVFILDRVTHYHKELLQTLEARLFEINIELILLAGKSHKIELARKRVKERVLTNEYSYIYHELKIKNLTFRYQSDITTIIESIKPDIVIMSSHVGNISSWLIMKLKKKLGFKLVAWQCGYEYNPSKVKDFLLNRFIKNFDYHLAYHSNAKKYALRYGAKSSQITVVHNAINEANIKLIDKISARKTLNKTLSIDIINKDIILYVGAILEEKNLVQLCQSIPLQPSDNTILIIVGDGPYLNILKQQFVQQNNIIFVGNIFNEVGLYFDCADIFVLPGTGGLAINEAMAHGLPIISSYADGSADDLVINNVNGLKLIRSTSTEISQCITDLLSSPETTKLMGQESKNMINKNFTYEKFIQRIVQSLEGLV